MTPALTPVVRVVVRVHVPRLVLVPVRVLGQSATGGPTHGAVQGMAREQGGVGALGPP